MTGTATAFGGPATLPSSVSDFKGAVRTSFSDAQSTAIDATKLRADSIAAMELNEMATKQLLAELESTTSGLKRMRRLVSSTSTSSQQSTLVTGSQRLPCSLLKTLPYSAGAMTLFAFLVALFLAWPQQSTLQWKLDLPEMHFWKHREFATS